MNQKVFIYVSFLFIFTYCEDIYYNHTNLDKNLVFVFSTYRHGARTIFTFIDHFKNFVPSFGALTDYGRKQHLEIGRNYRKRYSNFLNLNYDKNEIYIRSSDVQRTIISTEKELEGLFNKPIKRSDIQIVPNGESFWDLYHLNNSEHKEMDDYSSYCKKKRSLGPDYNEIFKTNIFPILKDCYGMKKMPFLILFCDSVFTAYFEYTYGNDKKNKIAKCGNENPKKFYDFCYDWYNTFRGWDEYAGYMFYKLYQHIFTYMDNAINKRSPLKMFMIGGHEDTVDKFMDFLDGMKIIPRTHYPHYACNIVIELRKYDDYYLEFYYNDILKYNNTYETFKKILDDSKYSNLYNYCGLPPWVKTQINQTKNDTIKHVINETKNIINGQNETQKKEMTNNITQNEINKKEAHKIHDKNKTNKQLDNKKAESSNDLMVNRTKNSSNNTSLISLKMKLRAFFRQEDDFNLYIILICIAFLITVLTAMIIIIVCIWRKRKKEFTRLVEEQKSKNNNNLSIINDFPNVK